MYLDYEKHSGGVYVIDIEADSLTPTIIWCLCWKNVLTGETGDCIGHEAIKKFFSDTAGAYYVGHNSLKFDAPVLVRLLGVKLNVSNVIDTLILSTLYNPSIENGHSLGAWGERLGYPKGDFHDFSKYSEEMLIYCRQDVNITCELFRRLILVLRKIDFSELSIKIQHHWTVILDRQHRNGFYFDGLRAMELYQTIRSQETALEELIHVAFPPQRVLVRTASICTKTGRPTAIYQKDCGRYVVEEDSDGGTYRAYEDVPFKISSSKQRTEKLIELGWEPEEFTPKTPKGGGGTPTPFIKGKIAPSLERFLDTNPTPEVALIGKWMALNGRANMINTWLNEWNEDDSCIHGKLFVADTLRLRHQSPNTANIPAVRVSKDGKVLRCEDGYYTYEARDLWTARPNRVLVGTDAAGLELRMLAHYLNRKDFTIQVVEGDPHQYNADTVGISRPLAKTLLYAIQYGAQAKKVASIVDCSVDEGATIRQQFLDRLGLTGVMNEAIQEQKQGRVSLVDGSKVICPSPHSALNYKLQGGGARVMALACVILEGFIRRDGLDSIKVGDIHDEWQYDVAIGDAEQHGKRAVQAIREAGEYLALNVPLDGESKVGRTWASTH